MLIIAPLAAWYEAYTELRRGLFAVGMWLFPTADEALPDLKWGLLRPQM